MHTNLKRRPATRTPKERIFVLTEGEVTEIEYLQEIRTQFELPKELIIIQKAKSTQAKNIVSEIVGLKKRNTREARRSKEAKIDQWWVVVDTECRPELLGNAIKTARDNGIFLALSDPSFEFWLRLHFGYTTAPYGSVDALIKELREKNYLPHYDAKNKHLDTEILIPLLATAMKNARQLRKNHTLLGIGQPRTDCDLLVDALADQSKPSLLTFEHKKFNSKDLSMNVLR